MKNKFMQIIVGTSLGLLALVSFAQIPVFGQSDQTVQSEQTEGVISSTIVGVWQTTVTPRNCMTGDPVAPSFQGLLTFNEGGTMAETSGSAGPTLRGPGHGIWNANINFIRP
ncbi:MAG: hypothetical protein ABIP78_08495 [Pyrinomonadaceae bacterium]